MTSNIGRRGEEDALADTRARKRCRQASPSLSDSDDEPKLRSPVIVINSSTASPEDDEPQRRGDAPSPNKDHADVQGHHDLTFDDVFGTPSVLGTPSITAAASPMMMGPASLSASPKSLLRSLAQLHALQAADNMMSPLPGATPFRTTGGPTSSVQPRRRLFPTATWEDLMTEAVSPFRQTPVNRMIGNSSMVLSPAGGPPYTVLGNPEAQSMTAASAARYRQVGCGPAFDDCTRECTCQCLSRDDRGEYIGVDIDPRNKIYPPAGAYYDVRSKNVKFTVDCVSRRDGVCRYPDYEFCTSHGRKCDAKLRRQDAMHDMWG